MRFGDFLFMNYSIAFLILCIRSTLFFGRNDKYEDYYDPKRGQPKYDAPYHYKWFFRTLIMLPVGAVILVPVLMWEAVNEAWPRAFPMKPKKEKEIW